MPKRIHKTDISFDITNATDAELDSIKNEVVKNLAMRAKAELHPEDLVSSHDRHYSQHSRDAAHLTDVAINPALRKPINTP